ncbi:MAG: LLM class flavin-dependent oxidoreductase [Betaproteobacteria bacterium]|nr:LLM class flavin-dependent oxidoreductase [Betaproteobacteria bacterium]
MLFGLFDHVDRNHLTLTRQFDERIEYVQLADQLGYSSYHVAEHHATPLNMVPVPSVYLGALAHATRNIRLGALTYLLPLYSPLCLIEELSMLDHLSHGRLDLGVGRGVSAFELNYHNVDTNTSREVFQETLDILLNGFTHDRLNHQGKHFNYKNVPMELKPLQKPFPPIWYPSSNEAGARYCGANGFHYVTLGPTSEAAVRIAAYREALKARGTVAHPLAGIEDGAAGINRRVVVADSDAEALRIAEPAFKLWHGSLTKLARENTGGPVDAVHQTADLKKSIDEGVFIVGSPDTVRREVEKQIKAMNCNFMGIAFCFGALKIAEVKHSVQLFADEVMAKLRQKAAA